MSTAFFSKGGFVCQCHEFFCPHSSTILERRWWPVILTLFVHIDECVEPGPGFCRYQCYECFHPQPPHFSSGSFIVCCAYNVGSWTEKRNNLFNRHWGEITKLVRVEFAELLSICFDVVLSGGVRQAGLYLRHIHGKVWREEQLPAAPSLHDQHRPQPHHQLGWGLLKLWKNG